MRGRRIPSLNWLRVFEAAARRGSFAAAADDLNVSAAAVSKQVRALEGHLGAPLFLRGARSVTLTRAGREFLPVVRQSLAAVEATAAALFGAQESAVVRIAMPSLIACSWFAERLPDFERIHPGIMVQVGGETAELGRDADLAIRHGGGEGAWRDGDNLFGEKVHPVAVPAIAMQIRSGADLLRFRLIAIAVHRTGWPEILSRVGVACAGDPLLRVVESTPTALALAAAGHGIALARSPASDFLARGLGLVPVMPELALESVQGYALVYPSRSGLNPAARTLRTWLLDSLRQPSAAGPASEPD